MTTHVSTSDQAARARAFHAMHVSGTPLVLANIWDVASARVAEAAGAPAVATTSAGVAWSLGAADGDRLGRDRAVELVARIAAAVSVPVSADIEGGFGTAPEGVASTVAGVLAAGAVGVNIEDAWFGGNVPLRPLPDQIARLAAARAAAVDAGVDLYLNARVDTYLMGVGEPQSRFGDVVLRAAAYAEAGASGIFVPGVTDAETVAALAKEIALPLNVLVGPGDLSVAEFAALGVARVSLGSGIAQAAYGLVRRAVTEVLTHGTYSSTAEVMPYGELNGLFR